MKEGFLFQIELI